MRLAWELGRQVLPDHSSKFSRKDYTLPQLFACLVLREHQPRDERAALAGRLFGRRSAEGAPDGSVTAP